MLKQTIITTALLVVITQTIACAQSPDDGYLKQEVTYANDTVTIAADLLLPDGDGPFPVVIWVHGSGNSPRTNPVSQAYAGDFLERRVAFLNPDKRGSGKSGGDWTISTFDDLASDVTAAVEFVSTLPQIDQTRITLLGFSQGSHIVSIAGSNPDVDKVISISGSVVSIHQQIRDEVRIMAANEGLAENEIRLIDSLNSLAFAYARSLQERIVRDNSKPDKIRTWLNYSRFRDQLSHAPFGDNESVSGFPTDSSDAKFRFLSTTGSFDPLEHWLKINKPILFIFGGNDENVDVHKTVSLLQDQLSPVNDNFVVLLFGQHGHAFIREDQMDFARRWIVEDEQ